ncbi:hypothetical protein VP01_655g6 [Puccinia sorghi]|uniref:Uncharacterized protein n=1 Tax=Puccinia sorghi TaxID=27349 RepID=A0A0L6UFD6_9BASI|nr:hypothetical protein VP01_655g6 [Puccinia sorghi]
MLDVNCRQLRQCFLQCSIVVKTWPLELLMSAHTRSEFNSHSTHCKAMEFWYIVVLFNIHRKKKGIFKHFSNSVLFHKMHERIQGFITWKDQFLGIQCASKPVKTTLKYSLHSSHGHDLSISSMGTKREIFKESLFPLFGTIPPQLLLSIGKRNNHPDRRLKANINKISKTLCQQINTEKKNTLKARIWDLPINVTALINQLASNHSTLHQLFKAKRRLDPLFLNCSRQETSIHLMNFCHKYKAARQHLRRNAQPEKIRFNWNNPYILLNNPKAYPSLETFLRQTGRFPFLSTPSHYFLIFAHTTLYLFLFLRDGD